jgi:hypothetical protein
VNIAVYHIELRQFPHNLCRFNLGEQELHATIVEPWAREEWIELGERKWSPHQAKLTVLEGPEMPLAQLSMGRGWRAAERDGHDVTERLLATAKASIAASAQARMPLSGSGSGSGEGHQDDSLLADSLGLQMLTRLADGPLPLRGAWELGAAHHPDRTPAQCLALAERAIASLLASRLIVLVSASDERAAPREVDEAEAQVLLRAVESWTGDVLAVARR